MIEHFDMAGWWFAVFDGEGTEPCVIARTEAEVRERLIADRMDGYECDREEAERWITDSGDVVIAKCAVRVAWINDIYHHNRYDSRLEWLKDQGGEP